MSPPELTNGRALLVRLMVSIRVSRSSTRRTIHFVAVVCRFAKAVLISTAFGSSHASCLYPGNLSPMTFSLIVYPRSAECLAGEPVKTLRSTWLVSRQAKAVILGAEYICENHARAAWQPVKDMTANPATPLKPSLSPVPAKMRWMQLEHLGVRIPF
jgi:hypothetical protein